MVQICHYLVQPTSCGFICLTLCSHTTSYPPKADDGDYGYAVEDDEGSERRAWTTDSTRRKRKRLVVSSADGDGDDDDDGEDASEGTGAGASVSDEADASTSVQMVDDVSTLAAESSDGTAGGPVAAAATTATTIATATTDTRNNMVETANVSGEAEAV
jgi:hypothetical protein